MSARVNVVIQTAFLGDLVLSTGLLKDLRLQSPSEKILLVCRAGLGDLFLKLKLVDAVIEVKKNDSSSYRSALRRLQQEKIKYLICPHRSLRTLFLTSRLRAEYKIGYKSLLSGIFFHRSLSYPRALPDVLRQKKLLTLIGYPLDSSFKEDDAAKFYFRAKDGQLIPPPVQHKIEMRKVLLEDSLSWRRLQERLSLSQFSENSYLIFPGSVWATKRWTQEGFDEVLRSLNDAGKTVYLMGSSDEKELCLKLAAEKKNVVVLAGLTSLYESLLLISRSRLVLANDSGSIHLAALADVPTIAFFGPTIVEQGFRPWSEKSWIIEDKSLSCRPCGAHGHHECPIKTHACMKNIKANKVIELLKTVSRL